ncbi:MAG: PEP-utilizing enzyme [Actinomycetota bacterium]
MKLATLMRDGWTGPWPPDPIEPDALHYDVPNECAWSRANLEESAPGVTTPMSWAFVAPSTIISSRITFGLMGLMTEKELRAPAPTTPDQVQTTLFYGRQSVNVDFFRRFIARVPGADPDDFERDIFGFVNPRDEREASMMWRAPVVFANTLRNSRRLPEHLATLFDRTTAWWRESTTALAAMNLDETVELFDQAKRRHAEVAGVHVFAFFLGQGHYARLTKKCVAADVEGLELTLSGGGSGTIEIEMIEGVEAIARGDSTVEAFVERYGYRGPHEGEISAVSWREDSSPVEQMVELYRADARERAGDEDAAEALQRLLGGLALRQRIGTERLVRRVQQYTQLRETGKAAFIACRDVGRAASRRMGSLLAEASRIDDPEDVFFLTPGDLGTADDLRAIVDARRTTWTEFDALELPDHFVGIPEATAVVNATSAAGPGDVIEGIGVSAGVIEGVARIVTNPAEFDGFEVGDILVCELTDPAWAPLMQLSAGLIIDIGGALSHGAIVARELGLPAIIGTGDGTKRIEDGQRVRIDGTAGTATIL